jgi:hypothetical protein
MRKQILKYIFLGSIIFGLNSDVLAQPVPDVPIPIDGGLSYLIAGGILYGVHRLRKSKKK